MNTPVPVHPYSPAGATLPGYVANTFSANELRAIFAAGSAVILGSTYRIVKRARPDLPGGEMATALWFTLSAFIHFFFEGYFSYNQASVPSRLDVFGQLWKEYSLSDSRYLTQDPFVVCMETVTAVFWGPLSLACAWCVVARHPLRHPLQLVVSLGQLYGDVLYFATCSFDELVRGVVYRRPEGFYYWWYYVFCNAFWIVVPFCLVLGSCAETKRAFESVAAPEGGSRSKKNV
ncbi:emopamil binding protein [Colletotrichum falcatum]|nr:emopamil binding protein [Colletotrichum falcatum]